MIVTKNINKNNNKKLLQQRNDTVATRRLCKRAPVWYQTVQLSSNTFSTCDTHIHDMLYWTFTLTDWQVYFFHFTFSAEQQNMFHTT